MRSRRLSAALLAGLAAAFVGFGAAPAFAASGPQTPSPPPVTNYAGYPGSDIVPDSCTAQGSSILTGEQYSMDGGAPVADMAQLGTVPATAKITMTWTGFAPGCETVGVSLSRKIAPSTNFTESVNQYLNVWSYCGPGGNSCAAVNNTLVLDLAASGGVTCYQLDANVGPPLEIVGPDGAFYGFNNEHNVLLSANNGGGADCTITPCPTPGTPADMPANSNACEGVASTTTSTAPPPTTPPTTAPPTTAPATTAPPVTAGGGQNPASTSAPCAPGQTRDAATGQCVAVLAGGLLPFTGSESADMARFGGAMVLGGLLFVVAAKRWRSA